MLNINLTIKKKKLVTRSDNIARGAPYCQIKCRIKKSAIVEAFRFLIGTIIVNSEK